MSVDDLERWRARWLHQLSGAGLSETRAEQIVALARPSVRLAHPPKDALLPQPDRSLPRTVAGLSSVTELAAGFGFTLALCEDGTAMAWGRNSSGQLGDGSVVDKITPVAVEGLTEARALAAGWSHCLALGHDGTVMAWGANYKTQLGDATTADRARPAPVAGIALPVTAIAAGFSHNLAVLSDGSVIGWGDNYDAVLGPSQEARTWSVPAQIAGLAGLATSVAAGSGVSAAVLADGSVQTWGGTLFGDQGGAAGEVGPHLVAGLGLPALGVAAHHRSVLILLGDGSVWTYSHPHYASEAMRAPVRVSLPGPAVAMSGDGLTALALMEDGSVLAWGHNSKGQLGIGETAQMGMHEPTPVQGLALRVRNVAVGRDHGAVVHIDGSVAHWGGDYPMIEADIVGADPAIPVGASKLGGRPDLAPTAAWPTPRGAPQAFVCQLDLAEVAPADSDRLLPVTGLLSFFYDLDANVGGYGPEDAGGWHVAHTPAGTRLERRDFPDELSSSMRFPGLPLASSSELTLPAGTSPVLEPLELDSDEHSAYYEAVFDYLHEEGLVHRVLGHAQPVQDDMSLECHLVPAVAAGPDGAGPEGAEDWLLVLQIDSDDDADMLWGDCGRLYYWILRQDLKASRFDRTWCFFQCY